MPMIAAGEDSRPGDASARILLIDDEPQISGFVGRALEHAGYQVHIAADAADGVRLAGSGGHAAYDLVILDLIMPDMDGRVVLGAILHAHPAQAVLILSCTADPATKAECLDRGAKDYLTKPFSLAELTARVRARLRENALRSEVMPRRRADAGRWPSRRRQRRRPGGPDQTRVPLLAGADGPRRGLPDQERAACLRLGN